MLSLKKCFANNVWDYLCVQNPFDWIAKLPAGLTLLTPFKKKDSVTSEKII